MALPDFGGPFDADTDSVKHWTQVPESIRNSVEQYVADRLPEDILDKLRDLRARGIPIGSDPAFFHFGGGLAVRNLCRERLSDAELAKHLFGADWDSCYIAVLVSISGMPR